MSAQIYAVPEMLTLGMGMIKQGGLALRLTCESSFSENTLLPLSLRGSTLSKTLTLIVFARRATAPFVNCPLFTCLRFWIQGLF